MYFDRSIVTPATVRVPTLKVPVEVVVAPVLLRRRPHQVAELRSAPWRWRSEPIVDVAVAVRVAPLSIEVCVVEDRPETVR